MKTGDLLNQLLEVAGIQKTDFAISLNIAPSGLSKILSGNRLPTFKERKNFIRLSANCLSEALFDDKCFFLLKGVFPVLYNFVSLNELERFLIDALEFAISQDYASENNESFDFPDRSFSYIGTKSVLNNFCVILSDSIKAHSQENLEVMSSLPLFDSDYKALFERVCVMNPHKLSNVSFHYYFSMGEYEDYFTKKRLHFLSLLTKLERFADFSLYTVDAPFNHPFLLLRNYFELHFSVQVDGTPIMTLIMNPLYHVEHYYFLKTKVSKKLNYSGEEARTFFTATPTPLIQKYFGGEISAVYNLLPIAYLLHFNDLSDAPISSDLFETISEALIEIVKSSRAFFITNDALHGFLLTGKIMFPGIGAVNIAKEKRVACIERYSGYAQTGIVDKLHVIRHELPRAVIICAAEANVIYFVADDGKKEHFIYFKKDILSSVLSEEINCEKLSIMKYNSELWEAYVKKIKCDATTLSH